VAFGWCGDKRVRVAGGGVRPESEAVLRDPSPGLLAVGLDELRYECVRTGHGDSVRRG